jgi:outer membrane protein OmpA-like peptidoglycan-associated protein
MRKAYIYLASFVAASFLLSAAAHAQPITVSVANEAAINTAQIEFSPTFLSDGIVFLSSQSAGLKKKKDNRLKMQAFTILQSKRSESGALQAPTPFSGALTTAFHEGPVCFNAAGDVIYFSSNITKGKRLKKAKDGEVKMKIYASNKVGDTWSEPKELPFNAEGQWNVCHPALSIDGDRLIFASDQTGGKGGMDLYVSYKVGENWAAPINLGNKINTSGNDIFPFVHADNTLYYSSDAKGKGGLDIFYSVADGADYVSPVNIGAPFNTAGDDFGLILDLNKINGYYTSNGNGGAGADDILSFHTENGNLDEYLVTQGRILNKQLDVTVNVKDSAGKAIANADVKLVKLDAGIIIGRDSTGKAIMMKQVNGVDVLATADAAPIFSEVTDANGQLVSDILPGRYAFMVGKTGFATKQLPVLISRPQNVYDFVLDASADLVRFNTVLFDDQNNAPLAGAMIIMKNKSTGQSETIYTDENGAIDYYVAGGADYDMQVYQNSTLIGEATMTSADIKAGGGSARTSLKFNAGLKAGSVIELPNIYYNFNDASLRPDARKDLDPVVALMNQYPKMRVRTNSYTDSRGSSASNADLSTNRAKSVLAYLASKGISSKRLEVKGFGESVLRNKCNDGVTCEEKEHARNRRTELLVLSGLEDSLKVAYRDGSSSGQTTGQAPAGSSKKLNFKTGTKFYVVAGSFLMQTRANARMTELVASGFENVSIVQFPKSPFYSVCVDKLETYEAAQLLKNEFVTKTSIDCFVRPD